MISLNPREIEDIAPPEVCASVPSALDLEANSCLLRAEGLRKAFGGQVILEGVDLEVRQGEVILLRGENGSGKTTLLNILTGNLEPDVGSIHYLADGTPRSFRFPRRWWEELNPFDHFTPEFVAREAMGRTWQDIRLFGSQSLRDNIAVAQNNHPGENPLYALIFPGRSSRREKEIISKADAMLSRLGLAGRETSSGDKVSLGQSKRVAIARAVAAGAKILFLDEPLAGLDRQGINEVLGLLESLVHESDVTLVIVEHVFNQSHLRGLITTDWLLAAGKLAVSKLAAVTPQSLAVATERPEWFDLLAGPDAEILDEPLPRGGFLTRIRRRGIFTDPPKPVLEICDLVVRRGARTVIGLDDEGEVSSFNLTLYEGEITILQAPNGWGKSTLLAAICGLEPLASGSILLQGEDLDQVPSWSRVKGGLRTMSSDLSSFPTLSVEEVFELASRPAAIADFRALSKRRCSSLSGGERQRVALRHAVSPEYQQLLVLLDEPFRALDRAATQETLQTLGSALTTSTLLLLPSPNSPVTPK